MTEENNTSTTTTSQPSALWQACIKLFNYLTNFVNWITGLFLSVQKLTKDILTEDDARSYCTFRVGIVVGLIALLYFEYRELFILKHVFNEVNFATAIAIIVGGTGAGLAAKQWSQGGKVPPAPKDDDN